MRNEQRDPTARLAVRHVVAEDARRRLPDVEFATTLQRAGQRLRRRARFVGHVDTMPDSPPVLRVR